MQKNVTALFPDQHDRKPASTLRLWRGFIKNFEIQASIGIYEEEFTNLQKISINIEYDYESPEPHATTDDSQVVCYAKLCKKIEGLVQEGHIYFIENLAEQIAHLCFEDGRVQHVKVHIEKFPSYINAQSLGIQITRSR